MINKGELYRLCLAVKKKIEDDYRAFDDDDIPGIQLTVACDNKMKNWSWQTGDNSFSGGAYLFPNWAVVGVYRSSNCKDLADDILSQLIEIISDREVQYEQRT